MVAEARTIQHHDPRAIVSSLITGGKRIGAVIARRFAEAGADVALVYNRSRDEAEATAGAIRALGRRARRAGRRSSTRRCARVVNQRRETLGRLDVLVNMASIYRARPFEELTAGRLGSRS